jgi:hypothetical protein
VGDDDILLVKRVCELCKYTYKCHPPLEAGGCQRGVAATTTRTTTRDEKRRKRKP